MRRASEYSISATFKNFKVLEPLSVSSSRFLYSTYQILKKKLPQLAIPNQEFAFCC